MWATDYYEKITSAENLESGTYLIVYEGGNLAFNGGLTTLDAASNTISVTISESKIESTTTTDAAAFTYDATAKTIKSASGYYIGQTSNANGLASNQTTTYENAISFDTDGNADIVSGGAYLRYNATSGQTRFRYYKSSSYTNQKAIQLYKLVSSSSTPTCAQPTFNPAAGTYTSAQDVTISTTTENATIYYTIDGSTPTTESTEYTAAIPVSETTTIKAIAVAEGYDNSSVATATYTIVALEHAGTEADPYTVADARKAIDANIGTTGVYVAGIVSQVDSYNSNYSSITYWISDDGTTTNQFEVYSGKGINGAAFSSVDDIQVGDVVVVSGDIKLYNNSTYEFNSNSQLVSLNRPVDTTPSIEVAPKTISVAAAETDGTIEVTYNNITDVAAEVKFYEADGTTETTYDWIVTDVNESNNVDYVIDENTSTEARTAYMKVYALDDEAEDVYSELITITQAGVVVDYATLPFEWEGGKSASFSALTGVSANGLGSDYGDNNSPYYIKFDGTGDYIQVKTNEQPGKVTIGVKMIGGASTSKITVQESTDGETFTDVQELSISGSQNSTLKLETTNAFAAASRYVRLYFTKGSNVGVGPITIAKVSADPNIALGTTTVTATADETEGTIDVTYTAIETDLGASIYWYTDETGATTTTAPDWIDAEINTTTLNVDYLISANTGAARTAYMKVYGVDADANDIYSDMITITQAAPVVTKTYTLATSITPGKKYIITDGSSVAMGYDKGNNRDAVSVTIDNGVASVASDAGVYEVTIYGPDASGLYSIYDETTEGYLYAAASNANHLKTRSTNTVDGKWAITFDSEGVASIIASKSSNRNVMRYNSSSSIFSCYAVDNNQADVYLYESEEAAVPTTATVTLNAKGYATYATTSALDFLDNEDADYSAWTISYIDGTSINFAQLTETVEGETGILLKGEPNAEVKLNLIPAGAEVSSNMLVAVTAPKDVNAEEYYGLSGNTFVKVGAGTVPAGKALLPADKVNGARQLTFNFGGETTGISTSLMNSEKVNSEIYNLNGQRVMTPAKGLYIVNGKKVVLK